MQSSDPENWPGITFAKNLTLYFGEETVRLIALPGGHTENDVIVWFETSKVVHPGDLMNAGISSFPVADLGAGGNALLILENVSRLVSLIPDGVTIIPGHGPLSDKAGLRSLQAMLVETIEVVRNKKRDGLSLQQIQAQGFPLKYDNWGRGYIDATGWIAMIYASTGACC